MFGNRLKNLREREELSQRDLAKLIQLSPSTVAMYELDQRSPDNDTLIKLANIFSCTSDYLLGISDLPHSIKIPETHVQLPILGTIRAGVPILAEENIEGYLDVPDNMNADYVLTVQGDSMIGVGILDGDLAICKELEEPRTGQIVVARKDVSVEYSEATLKFYFNGNGQPVLRAANPSYPDIDYHGEKYKTVGCLVAVMRRDAPGYEIYTDFLSVKDYEEWTEVIELAAANGLAPQDLISLVNINLKMIKRLRG